MTLGATQHSLVFVVDWSFGSSEVDLRAATLVRVAEGLANESVQACFRLTSSTIRLYPLAGEMLEHLGHVWQVGPPLPATTWQEEWPGGDVIIPLTDLEQHRGAQLDLMKLIRKLKRLGHGISAPSTLA